MEQKFDPVEIHDPLKVYGTISDQRGNIKPCKVYSALVTQSSTTNPVATIMENTLGGTPVWTREGVGYYYLTLANKFTVGKTLVIVTNGYGRIVNWNDDDSTVNRLSFSVLALASHFEADGWRCSIEVRVYD